MCVQNKCQDPCPGTCGQNAECWVVNHHPLCTCRSGFTGDPFIACTMDSKFNRFSPITIEDSTPCGQMLMINHSTCFPVILPVKENVCNPSPCGPNSQCKEVSGQAVCSCLPTYVGTPPGCRPECVASSECPTQLACKDYKCVNPCPSPCGLNTKCIVVNHSPICSCMPGYSGDPFTTCAPIPRKMFHHVSTIFNPCTRRTELPKSVDQF